MLLSMLVTAAVVEMTGQTAGAAPRSVPLKSSIQIGYLSAIDLDTRDNQMGRLGVTYTQTLKQLSQKDEYATSLFISAEYSARGDYYYLPVLANYKWQNGTGLYYLAGVGVGLGKRPDGAVHETLTQVAFQAGVGYDLNLGGLPSLFEVRFVGGQHASWNSIGFYYGVRF